MRSDRTGARSGELTAGVNLLPQEVDAERRVHRRAVLSAVGVAVFAVVLGGVYLQKLDQVRDAETARDDAAAEVASLEQEVAALQEYRVLADSLAARNAVLAEAMGGEVSFASSLNDLALAFPASASLDSLNLALVEAEEPGEGDIAFGAPVAELTYSGYSVERYAPGVETVLVEFDRVSSLFNVYLNTAAEEEVGGTEVYNFDGSAGVDESARTGRYRNGLPAEEAP